MGPIPLFASVLFVRRVSKNIVQREEECNVKVMPDTLTFSLKQLFLYSHRMSGGVQNKSINFSEKKNYSIE